LLALLWLDILAIRCGLTSRQKTEAITLKSLGGEDCTKYNDARLRDLFYETLSEPVAVFPKWTENSMRVKVLQSIFTVERLPLLSG
jgi:hypothetical protein